MASEAIVVKPEESLTLQKVGVGLFKSGLFPNAKNEYGAFAIVEYGAELGVGPMMALKNINIISGQVACNAQLMLSLALRNGVTYTVKQETDTGAIIEFKRGEMVYTSEFSKKDAESAGLLGKDNWKKYPKDMYFWRCVAKGVRRVAPDAVMGLYTPDEITEGKIMDVTEVQADVADVQPEPEQEDKYLTMQKEIGSWLCEMYGGIVAAEDKLEELGSFTNKQGKVVKGKRSVFDLGTKENDKGQSQTSITHSKVHKMYEEWQKYRNVTEDANVQL